MLKIRINAGSLVFVRQFLKRSHQSLRHEHPAVGAKVARGIWNGGQRTHDQSVPRKVKKSKVETRPAATTPLSSTLHGPFPPPRHNLLHQDVAVEVIILFQAVDGHTQVLPENVTVGRHRDVVILGEVVE